MQHLVLLISLCGVVQVRTVVVIAVSWTIVTLHQCSQQVGAITEDDFGIGGALREVSISRVRTVGLTFIFYTWQWWAFSHFLVKGIVWRLIELSLGEIPWSDFHWSRGSDMQSSYPGGVVVRGSSSKFLVLVSVVASA
jgi:hypothetical protein